MKDVYGNYFIQSLIKNSNQTQIDLIIKYIKKDFVTIALDYSGTHVLQTLLDMIKTPEEEIILLNSIKGNELKMAFDINATHVLQKMISIINEIRRNQINIIILDNIKILTLDVNGICLVKKFIEYTSLSEIKDKIIKILSDNCIEISQSPYGNYAIQFILEEWGINKCEPIVNIIINNICSLSVQKYSSNVSEKIIELLDFKKQNLLINDLFFSNKFINILRNKYGKYVIQKAIKSLNNNQKDDIYNYLIDLKFDPQYGKDKMKIQNILGYFDNE